MSKYNEYKGKARKLGELENILTSGHIYVGTVTIKRKDGSYIDLTIDKSKGTFSARMYR